jgi:HD superfamily phosphohydrolase YqeK/predicted RNA-binding Zn-ribbon protein involved in translation (DUF1610 family)
MDHQFCPGAGLLRQPKPDLFHCPHCGSEVEIWTDEFKRPCPDCGRSVFRDANLGCIEWCAYAEECVGEETFSDFVERKQKSIRERLLDQIGDYFGSDVRRIDHAKAVLGFAEEILREVKADWHIVVPASILHDVGIKIAEEKYGSAEPKYQEAEGPPVAEKMLRRIGCNPEHVKEICHIIAHHHSPGPRESVNFQVLFDADALVNNRKRLADGKLQGLRFYSEAATKIARRLVGEANA